MNLKKHLLEAATLLLIAGGCAFVANALASRDHKMNLAGSYPNAMTVPVAAEDFTRNTTRFDTTANQVSVNQAQPAPPPPPAPTAQTASLPRSLVDATSVNPGKAAMIRPDLVQTRPSPPTSRNPQTPPAPAATKSAPEAVANPLARFAPHENEPYIELHGDDVAALHQSGALFLDARRSSAYQEGHIASARSFPVWESDIDARVTKLYEERGTDPARAKQPIVIYCTGGDCEDSHMLAQKLWGVQFNNVYVYKDGFPDWQKRGGSIHTGDTP